MTNKTLTRIGLRDVIAGNTHLCRLGAVDDHYCGYSINELVEKDAEEQLSADLGEGDH